MHRWLVWCAVLSLAAAGPAVAGGEEDAMLDVGSTFVEFELPAHDGSTVASDDLEGSPYLLYFYPKADTPGCTKEACALRDSWSKLESLGLRVFGVSYDSPDANRRFAEKHDLPFLLLSDEERELARKVGASRAVLPVPKRISYLVGEDGKILATYPSVDPAGHAAEVLADFRTLSGS